MANRNNISFSTIFKRSCSLDSTKENKSNNAQKRYNISKDLLESAIKDGRINPSLKNNINDFLNSINNSNDANNYYREALDIISKLSILKENNKIDESYFNFVVEAFSNKVLPYIENVSVIEEVVDRYDLDHKAKEKIISWVESYCNADRVIKNHKHISNRFNIISEVSKAKSRDLQMVIEKCCDMIDTYNIPSYAKFNLCLEELGYLFEKEGIKVDKPNMVKYITEYFLLRSVNLSESDISNYRRVLNENCYITDNDIELSIKEYFDPVQRNYQSISSLIDQFMIKDNKSEQDLLNIIKFVESYDSIIDITNNFHKIVWLLWLVYRKEIMNNELIIHMVDNLKEIIIKRIEKGDFNQSNISILITKLTNLNNVLVIGNSDSKEYNDSVSIFKDNIIKIIDELNKLDSLSYSDNNIASINFVNGDNIQPMTLNEFKIFKFHNLITAAINLDKYLKCKAKRIYKKGTNGGKKIIGKIKDILFAENDETLYSIIGSDGKADICKTQIEYDEENIHEVIQALEEICHEYNSILKCNNNESVKCYYILHPQIAEIHLKEATTIMVTEDEKHLIDSAFDESSDIYIEQLASSMALINEMNYLVENNISLESFINNFKDTKDFNIDKFTVALEALSFLDIDEDQIKRFGENYNKYRYNNTILESANEEKLYIMESSMVNSLIKKWEPAQNVSLLEQFQSLQILEAIFEADLPKDKDQEERKNPFKGINLNSLRLYLEGLKKNISKMSSKEKEFSRNIDNNFRLLVKSFRNALISDRREAIIKGSVIPSFSRCIKICIGLAGLGFVTGNPLVPLLTAFAGFAASKKLTKKERVLLLDEIETELQVVEKELSMAESKNQLKKYRTLLKYKKDLQRQYQRIRYNIRVGKDILPNSAAGIRNVD